MRIYTNPISNTEDVIDSLDIIDRIEALTNDPERTAAECKELEALTSLASECDDASPDWSYGVTLVRDSYFVTYASEYADDIGATDRNASWPFTCIDWEQAADELKMDYTAVDFDGVTFWVR